MKHRRLIAVATLAAAGCVVMLGTTQPRDAGGAPKSGDPVAPFLHKQVKLSTSDGQTFFGTVSDLAWSGSEPRGYTPYIVVMVQQGSATNTYCFPHTAISSIRLVD